ncbi:hypothetical protein PybrP1_004302 [[Pythium] brassicae (nom. inval.)]|nr:hypothetical protein PybrP1_004302 [[Pythium] brassicae (nom. inval.)]
MTTLRHRSTAPTNDSAASRNFLAPKKTLYDRVTYFVPSIKWFGNYNWSRDVGYDIISGITVTMMLIPQEVSLSTIMHVSLVVGTTLNPIESEKERIKVEHATYPPQTVYKIFQSIDKTNKYSFWVGTLSILFLYTLRFAKKRFFPTPIVPPGSPLPMPTNAMF